jgi:hypothetical protein
MADITARHGTVSQLPEKERHFTSAFVVVSAAPASDEVMTEVALRAAAFGDGGQHRLTESFAMDTDGRASMDNVLGPRRAVSDALPPPRAAFTCDVITQDCDDLACYGQYCALPVTRAVGDECSVSRDCGAGATCIHLDSAVGSLRGILRQPRRTVPALLRLDVQLDRQPARRRRQSGSHRVSARVSCLPSPARGSLRGRFQ